MWWRTARLEQNGGCRIWTIMFLVMRPGLPGGDRELRLRIGAAMRERGGRSIPDRMCFFDTELPAMGERLGRWDGDRCRLAYPLRTRRLRRYLCGWRAERLEDYA